MKILIAEFIWPNGIDELEKYGDVEYVPDLWKNRELLLSKVKDVDALIIRNQTKVDGELLLASLNLKVIGRLGVGLDNIDVHAAKAREIKVVFAKNANATSVSEYVMAAILEASRNLTIANNDVRLGNWDRKRFTGSEISGKVIGLIGLGEIARRVAKRAIAFGMDVYGFDPFVTKHDYVANELGVYLTSFEELIEKSDFISIHVPLTKSTKNMFSTTAFKIMKRNAFVINTSRGGIINEKMLAEAISNNEIGGAFLDVLEEEPVDAENLLLNCKNVYLTPHIAGLTKESQFRTSELVAEEVGKVLQGKSALCVL